MTSICLWTEQRKWLPLFCVDIILSSKGTNKKVDREKIHSLDSGISGS